MLDLTRVCVAAMVVAVACGAQPADDAAGRFRQWQDKIRQTQQKQLSGLKPLEGQWTMAEVFSPRLAKNRWAIKTALPVADGWYSLRITGWDEPAAVHMETDDTQSLTELSVFLYEYPPGGILFTETQLVWETSSMAICRLSKLPLKNGPDGGDQVALRFLSEDDENGKPTMSVQLSAIAWGDRPRSFSEDAVSLSELRREYPKEVNTHLRPVLIRLRLEGLLAPDTRTAIQVLADELVPPPQLVDQANQIIADLDHDEFEKREAAEAALRKLGVGAPMAIAKMDRSKLSTQQNATLDAMFSEETSLTAADLAAMRSDRAYLLDCLTHDDPLIRQAAIKRLSAVVGEELTFDPDAPENTRAAAFTKLSQRLAPATHPTTAKSP